MQLDEPQSGGLNGRMAASSSVTVRIDLARIRASAQEIRRRTGVAILAVVKADAYGLGAAQVAEALADLADGWCVFSLAEAMKPGCGSAQASRRSCWAHPLR
jgi:hypothetical protein